MRVLQNITDFSIALSSALVRGTSSSNNNINISKLVFVFEDINKLTLNLLWLVKQPDSYALFVLDIGQ